MNHRAWFVSPKMLRGTHFSRPVTQGTWGILHDNTGIVTIMWFNGRNNSTNVKHHFSLLLLKIWVSILTSFHTQIKHPTLYRNSNSHVMLHSEFITFMQFLTLAWHRGIVCCTYSIHHGQFTHFCSKHQKKQNNNNNNNKTKQNKTWQQQQNKTDVVTLSMMTILRVNQNLQCWNTWDHVLVWIWVSMNICFGAT